MVLTVNRNGQELDFTVTRKRVEIPVATYEMLPSGYGLVTIENFEARASEETLEAIDALMEQGAKGLIFDVRFNPGGYTTELVKILDYLLPEGPLFRRESYDGQTSVDYSDAQCVDLPMAVLANKSSYSAAEFFAAALQEYDAAVVVGEQTTGKGYYQKYLSVSRWLCGGHFHGEILYAQGRKPGWCRRYAGCAGQAGSGELRCARPGDLGEGERSTAPGGSCCTGGGCLRWPPATFPREGALGGAHAS